MDIISKLLGMPEYYLDTNAVRKLTPMLSEGVHDSVLTSIYTIIELIGNIKDEASFQRQKAILEKLAKGKFKIDPLLPEEVQMEAFNIHLNSDVSSQIVDLMIRLICFDTYENWVAFETVQEPHPNIYEYVQITDKQQSFAQMLEKHFSDVPTKMSINDFNKTWDESQSRDLILTRVVEYYVEKRKQMYPDRTDQIRYDSSINLFMLVHAHYVDKKVAYHNKPGRNDFQDLMHLLYVRQGITLVTDDRHFRENVNEVWNGRAITTDEFLQRYRQTTE